MRYKLNDKVTILKAEMDDPKIKISFLSYLIQGTSNILVDTVPEEGAETFIRELEEVCPIAEIDTLILNHSEEDHSGALKFLIAKNPGIKILCTAACKNRLLSKYPKANYHVVDHHSVVEVDGQHYHFIHTPGLHWDDNMVTFWKEEKMLFSNDLFGQYLKVNPPIDMNLSEDMIEVETEIYFAKVFGPSELSEREVISDILWLKPKLIAPGHGVVVQEHVKKLESIYLGHLV